MVANHFMRPPASITPDAWSTRCLDPFRLPFSPLWAECLSVHCRAEASGQGPEVRQVNHRNGGGSSGRNVKAERR